jgi:flagellar biosynthesis component FlhA
VDNKLQKRKSGALKENSQYALAFGLIGTMLYIAGFPMFVIFFFGIFAYFLWKTFSQPSRNGTREVFEFYLSANEVLRDDERRWFGFEVQEVIVRGERILQMMNGAPPLVYFTLGALYNKIGDHKSAISHLAYVTENEKADESSYVYPSLDLRNYARILRKIEREPSEAPQTSSAVRALERARRNRGKIILENSRLQLKELEGKKEQAMLEQKAQLDKLAIVNADNAAPKSVVQNSEEFASQNGRNHSEQINTQNFENRNTQNKRMTEEPNADPFVNRKPISEVLHDIYDRKQ